MEAKSASATVSGAAEHGSRHEEQGPSSCRQIVGVNSPPDPSPPTEVVPSSFDHHGEIDEHDRVTAHGHPPRRATRRSR